MAKRSTRQPAVGDVYAIPLEGGRFAACRVLKASPDSTALLVANVNWIGTSPPDIDDPVLRTVLRLTHHNWDGKACAVWVDGDPPRKFTFLGNVPLRRADKVPKESGTGAWGYLAYQPQAQWYWEHPDQVPPPPPPPEGRFILHRFNGDEVYRLASAKMSAHTSDGGVTLWFDAKSEREGAQRCEDTDEIGAAPNASVGVENESLAPDELVGRVFLMQGTKTDDEDSCMSLLYYCEHQPLRENRIEVVSQAGDCFRVRWTGVTQDVNYYDGSKPRTRVEIEGVFRFADIDEWRE
jgi:hypothetical protein